MLILWDENNIAHLARHGVTPALAEKIIEAGLFEVRPTDINYRFIYEATIDNKHYRLVCDIAPGKVIYPVTAFSIRKRKNQEVSYDNSIT